MDPVCPKCGYNLTGLTHSRCPECGGWFDPIRVLLLAERAPEPLSAGEGLLRVFVLPAATIALCHVAAFAGPHVGQGIVALIAIVGAPGIVYLAVFNVLLLTPRAVALYYRHIRKRAYVKRSRREEVAGFVALLILQMALIFWALRLGHWLMMQWAARL